MESIWRKTEPFYQASPLPGDLSADVAIVGGGLAGMLIAYFLKSFGIDVRVLEAYEIGSGQTQNTTAKITSQHNLMYHRLLNQIGLEKALQYYEANQAAIKEYKNIVERQKIDCDFKVEDAYLYTCADPKTLDKEAQAAQKIGIDASWTNETTLPFPVSGALQFPDQAAFHPLKFLHAIAEGIPVYTHTCVQEVGKHTLLTNRGTVKAKNMIFATHYPLLNKKGLYFLRLYQERSYLLALKNAETMNGMYLGIDSPSFSFRNQNDLLLMGGESHRVGTTSKTDHFDRLTEAAQTLYPSSQMVARWSAQDCMSIDGIPYIGRLTSRNPNVYVATGFNKWGMTGCMVAAMILSDQILGRKNRYEEVFSPQRFFLRASFKRGMIHIGHSVVGLSTGMFTPRGKRCSHMGCRLHKSGSTHTLDCPCHGSRFQDDGTPIDLPAVTKIK